MDIADIGVFGLAARRLEWLDRRQALLAQNVANANTPGWRMRDVAPFSASATPQMAATAPGQLAGHPLASGTTARPQEISPSGNGVSIEDQLSRVADTAGEQELALNLVRRWGGMLKTAYGRG